MIPVDELDELRATLDENPVVLLFVWRHECAECPKLQQRLDRSVRKFPPLVSYSICLDDHPTAAARFGVFEPPAVAIFKHGKMVSKQSGAIDLSAVTNYLDKLFSRPIS